MNVVSGENPPVAINSKSQRLRLVILMEGSLAARANSSSRSLPSTNRFTSLSPYGLINFAFDITFDIISPCCNETSEGCLVRKSLPKSVFFRHGAQLYPKIQSMNFEIVFHD